MQCPGGEIFTTFVLYKYDTGELPVSEFCVHTSRCEASGSIHDFLDLSMSLNCSCPFDVAVAFNCKMGFCTD